MRTQGFSEGRVGFGGMGLGPVSKALLIYYGAVFVVQIVLHLAGYLGSVLPWFAFVPADAWQSPILLYRAFAYLGLNQFEIFGFLMNLLSIFFIGNFLENSMGSRRLLGAFFFSAIFASVGYLLLMRDAGSAALLGPSTACLGMLACAATLYPKLEVIFLIFPLPMWVVAGIIALIQGFSLITGQRDLAWAYLLALGGGFLFAWNLRAHVPLWKKLWPEKAVARWKHSQAQRRQRNEREERAELDRILGKIGDSGIGSLTPEEKRFLDRRSRELRK